MMDDGWIDILVFAIPCIVTWLIVDLVPVKKEAKPALVIVIALILSSTMLLMGWETEHAMLVFWSTVGSGTAHGVKKEGTKTINRMMK